MKRKSFILHLDSLQIFEGMTNEQKGELFEAIRQYHLGNEPTLSPLLNIIFIPFKNQFDRDFIKYDRIVERNRANGNQGGRPPSTENQTLTETKETHQNPVGSNGSQNNLDSKNDSKNENESKKENDLGISDSGEETSPTQPKKKSIEERKKSFKESISKHKDQYSSELLNDFWRYWTEMNEGGKKMRFEMQKVFDVGRRLTTWSNRDNNNFKNGKTDKRGHRHEPSKDITSYGKL